MKKFALVSLGALVALGACNDVTTVAGPNGPNFELVDVDSRIAGSDVNAHVYGSFALSFTETVGTPGGTGVITSGSANFPGNPKNAGTCDNGLWINPQGKRTSGNMDKPHPHCIGETEGSEQEVVIHVVLEPISARYYTSGGSGKNLDLASPNSSGRAYLTGGGDHSRGEGMVVAYAIDASTLGTTNRRIGTLTFDMSQYHQNNIDYFEVDCVIDDTPSAPRCLDLVISATYEPLAGSDGVGETTENVTGYLYWSSATAPFNYPQD